MIYDLLVIGNGLSAKVFLFEFFNSNEINCQNLSIAQVSSEEFAPNCTSRSTATVSLNGIEEGVSALGDLLLASYKSFVDFTNTYKPDGVESVKQFIFASDEVELSKLQRRHSNLISINHPLLKNSQQGVELDSYLVFPAKFLNWLDDCLHSKKIYRFDDFVTNVFKDSDSHYSISFQSGKSISAKKIIFCNGAYSKIFEKHFSNEIAPRESKVVSGSYIEKKFDFPFSFYFTLDGHNLIYRKEESKLILGSSSMKGSFEIPNLKELFEIYKLFSTTFLFDIGPFENFEMKNGLRLKGIKRIPFFGAHGSSKSLFEINGLYKNGYSYSFYLSKKVVSEIASLL